jgi:hypothetical protein
MHRDDYRDDRYRRRGRDSRRQEDDEDDIPRKKTGIAVTLLGVYNLVAGLVVLVFGFCGSVWGLLMQGTQIEPPGLPGLGGSKIVTLAQIAFIFFFSTGTIVAAIGLLCRGGWSRMFALILGGFAGSAGCLYAFSSIMSVTTAGVPREQLVVSVAGSIFFLGYCVATFWILLHPRRVAEFQ